MPNKDRVPALFEEHKIRRVADKGIIYYSAIDIIAAITESKDPGNLWAKTKPSLKADGIQLANIIHRFKLLAIDGKMRLTDCLSAENVILMIEYLHESACRDGIEKTDAYGRPQIDGIYDVVDSIISDTKPALESAFDGMRQA